MATNLSQLTRTSFARYLDNAHLQHQPHQFNGVEWCVNNEHDRDKPSGVRGGFIADEMGLGKTIMMVATIHINPLPHTLIVLPPVLIKQWEECIVRTTGIKPIIYHGHRKNKLTLDALLHTSVVITTYGNIFIQPIDFYRQKITNKLHLIQWDRIIFDEAHHLRNRRNITTQSARFLKADIRWLISGTPIQNKKDDFYSLCSVLRLSPIYYTNHNNLSDIAKHFIIKRTKAAIGITMTDIVHHNNTVSWQNTREEALSQTIHAAIGFTKYNYNDSIHAHPLELFLRARQSCTMPSLLHDFLQKVDYDKNVRFTQSSKLDTVVQTILRNLHNHNLKLVFCSFRAEIDYLYKHLSDNSVSVQIFDGRVSERKRNHILKQNYQVILLQIQTGCEGLNLQQYNEIYFVSPHWNPAVEQQAIARCHRIGQTKPVHIYRFHMDKFKDNSEQQQKTDDIIKIKQKNKQKQHNNITQNDAENNEETDTETNIEAHICSIQQNKTIIAQQILPCNSN